MVTDEAECRGKPKWGQGTKCFIQAMKQKLEKMLRNVEVVMVDVNHFLLQQETLLFF